MCHYELYLEVLVCRNDSLSDKAGLHNAFRTKSRPLGFFVCFFFIKSYLLRSCVAASMLFLKNIPNIKIPQPHIERGLKEKEEKKEENNVFSRVITMTDHFI